MQPIIRPISSARDLKVPPRGSQRSRYSKELISAEYPAGQCPIIKVCGEHYRDYATLANGSRIPTEWLDGLTQRLIALAPKTRSKTVILTKPLYPDHEWVNFLHRKKCLLGMGLAYLVNSGLVPLTCINPDKSGIRKYQFTN